MNVARQQRPTFVSPPTQAPDLALDGPPPSARNGADSRATLPGTTATSPHAAPRSNGQREKALVAIAGTGLTAKMPERPLTIATYAAGASLAAITLVYVFGPTFFLDDGAANSSRSSRKKGVVGLVNPANDCFINSVLQALAGLPELRSFLIKEVHRRKLDGPELYQDATAVLEANSKKQQIGKIPEWKLAGLQQGLVTGGLKDVLDALNERPIYRKTISAQNFIRVVEHAFKTRISRTQQDAQEFLQVILERLAEEHEAASRLRRTPKHTPITRDSDSTSFSTDSPQTSGSISQASEAGSGRDRSSNATLAELGPSEPSTGLSASLDNDPLQDENTFPLEGKLESHIECSYCHFQPKPSVSQFLVLTLNVPYDEFSTTLSKCLDGMFKLEDIDDFTCDRCRLDHALQVTTKELLSPLLSEKDRARLESHKTKFEDALRNDPETPPKDVPLPDLSSAPKRRIARHTRMSAFPQVLTIHLSRSVWNRHSISTKNMARVTFPETLSLGGLMDRKTYRLLGVITHKGGHNGGHYETFRRQVLTPPFSTPASMGTEGVYSLKNTPAAMPKPSHATIEDRTSLSQTPSLASSFSFPSRHAPSTTERKKPALATVPLDAIPTPGLPSLPADRAEAADAATKPAAHTGLSLLQRKLSTTSSSKQRGGAVAERWWRISDDRIKECKTSDVLSMQREVYLLFYEMMVER